MIKNNKKKTASRKNATKNKLVTRKIAAETSLSYVYEPRVQAKAWTPAEDTFIRRYRGLPTAELTSALNKRFRFGRSYDAVTKRAIRLRTSDKHEAILRVPPRVTLTVAGVEFSANLNPAGVRRVLKAIPFNNAVAVY